MLDLLKSKTFWAGLLSVVTGGAMLYAGQPGGVQMIAGGLVAMFLRDAVRKLGGTPEDYARIEKAVNAARKARAKGSGVITKNNL